LQVQGVFPLVSSPSWSIADRGSHFIVDKK